MTVYIKELIDTLSARYAGMKPDELTGKLLKVGVLDPTMCKVLTIREYVFGKVKEGQKKIDAMWDASEKFSCTYEYVRKCIYYYTDVNLD